MAPAYSQALILVCVNMIHAFVHIYVVKYFSCVADLCDPNVSNCMHATDNV